MEYPLNAQRAKSDTYSESRLDSELLCNKNSFTMILPFVIRDSHLFFPVLIFIIHVHSPSRFFFSKAELADVCSSIGPTWHLNQLKIKIQESGDKD